MHAYTRGSECAPPRCAPSRQRARRTATLTGVTLHSTVEGCVLCGYVARYVGAGQVVSGILQADCAALMDQYSLGRQGGETGERRKRRERRFSRPPPAGAPGA